MPGKEQVRLAFCDLAPDWDARDNYFTQALEHAGWEITFCNGPEEKPDFVLCGTFGFDFLKYDCCRIQFSGEDSWPDLNLYDYAMGFEVLDFGAGSSGVYKRKDAVGSELLRHFPDVRTASAGNLPHSRSFVLDCS